MKYQFTAGAERALNIAADWMNRDDCNELTAEGLLVGLISEPECRAAAWLIKHGINRLSEIGILRVAMPQNSNGAQQSVPNNYSQYSFSNELTWAIREVTHLSDGGSNPALATEHLLLAVLLSDGIISEKLREKGLSAGELEADIRLRYGIVSANETSVDPLDYFEEPSAEPHAGSAIIDLNGMGLEDVSMPNRSKAGDLEKLEQKNESPVRSSIAAAAGSTNGSTAAFRVIDASANRGQEGLRVVEDFLRFALDDRHLTSLCKQLRHDMVEVLKQLPQESRIACRETQEDVGTTLSTSAESSRDDFGQLLTANFARIQESMRSLEEFGKFVSPAWGAAWKQLRYRCYTLHRASEILQASLSRLQNARLYALIDGRTNEDEFARHTTALVEAGVHVLQLRDKKIDDRTLTERARMLRDITAGTATLFVVNDRPDVAALCRADGVHVGQEEMSVKDARTIVGPNALIGVSTHSVEQARQAVLDGANYIGVGPTFPSTTKSFKHFPGLELLKSVAAEVRLPAFAIGGITLERLPEVLATGIGRVAVSGAISDSDAPASTVKTFLDALQ